MRNLPIATVAVGLVALVIFSISKASEPSRRDVVLPTADTAGATRAVRLGRAMRLSGTETRFIPVHYGTAFSETAASSYSRSGIYSQPIVNALFVEGAEARLLLQQPAYIQTVIFPDSSTVEPSRMWLAYHVALHDTNGDGVLNHHDGRSLAISDLDGGNWRVVLPEGVFLHGTEVLDAQRILVTAFDTPPPARGDDSRLQQILIYEVATGSLTRFDAANAAVERAGRILGR